MAAYAVPLFTVTFQVGSTDYTCVLGQAEFQPSTPTLTADTFCGVKQGSGRTTWNVILAGFQDWWAATSLARYLNTNNGKTATISVAFPDDSATPKTVT